MSEANIYRVAFAQQNQVYEVYVKHVYQGELYGFVVLEDFLFGEKSAIVVDPSEEKLRSEFATVQRCFVPMHAIFRIDQVKKRGTAKITALPTGSSQAKTVYSPEKKQP